MEEFAPVDTVIVWLENFGDLFGGEIDILKVMLPCEMNTHYCLAFGWAQWYVILENTSNLSDLHVVFE